MISKYLYEIFAILVFFQFILFLLLSTPISFIFYILVLLLFGRITLRFRENKFVAKNDLIIQFGLVYTVVSLLGSLVALTYNLSYGEYFAPFGDDSMYFNHSELFSFTNISSESNVLTLTTVLNSIFYNFVNLIKKPNLIDLLIFHWAFASLVCLISYDIACSINKKKINIKYLLIPFLGSFAVYFTLLHYYRDTYAILFLSISILNSINKNYSKALLFAVLSGLVRGANGFMAIFALLLLSNLNPKKSFSKYGKLKIVLVLATLFLIFSIPSVQESFLLRAKSFATNTLGGLAVNEITISNYIRERQVSLIEGEGLYNGGETLGSGFRYNLKLSIMPIFSPGNLFFKPTTYYAVNTYEKSRSLEKIFNTTGLFYLIAMVMLPLLLSYFITSITFLLKSKNNKDFVLLLLFILFYFGVAYISLLPRHYLAFLILMPAALSAPPERLVRKQKLLRFTISIATIVVLSINTLRNLFNSF